MSTDASRLISALRSSPFWNSPSDVCACDKGPTIAGLDLVWYYRKYRQELDREFSIDGIVAYYLAGRRANVTSPNLAFDEFWYLQRYRDADQAVKKNRYVSGWEHYLAEGAENRLNPAFWFDERWYARQNADVALALREGRIVCGFEHYLREGVHTDSLPSIYFNSAWYRNQYLSGDEDRRVPIIEYLSAKPKRRLNPVPFFDEEWYANQYFGKNDNEAHPALSSYEHYIFIGRSRSHSPSPNFNEAEYRTRYPEVTRSIIEGKYSSAMEHYATEGVINGYVATGHLHQGALDYRTPKIVQAYEQSLTLNLKQAADLRQLVRDAQKP